MNSPEVETASTELAARLQTDSDGDFNKAVDLAYRLTVARPPTKTEQERAMN
jgi:hypothetical protein